MGLIESNFSKILAEDLIKKFEDFYDESTPNYDEFGAEYFPTFDFPPLFIEKREDT